MNHIISVKDMCLWYGEHQALKNVNIDIPEKALQHSLVRLVVGNQHS